MIPAEPGAIEPAQNIRCLACGATNSEKWASGWDSEYLTTDESFTFHRCVECNVLFIDPVPSDRLSQIYPSNYYSFASPDDSFVYRGKEWLDGRMFKHLLRKLEGNELSVLDVGGGAGWQLSSIKAIDPRVNHTQVVDFDAAAAAISRTNGHEYFLGRIEEYETDKKFDFILMLNLIEHVEDPSAVLKKVNSILSPQGIVLIKTPNYDSLDGRLFRNHNWAGYHCPRHWVLFTKESFIQTATRVGLTVKEFAYTQGAAFWASSILFVLAKRGYVSITQERPAMFHPLFPAISAAFAGFEFVRSPFGKLSQMFFVLTRDETGGLKTE